MNDSTPGLRLLKEQLDTYSQQRLYLYLSLRPAVCTYYSLKTDRCIKDRYYIIKQEDTYILLGSGITGIISITIP
jgi:hypothetical protein